MNSRRPPHARLHQPPQTIDAIGEAPVVERRGLIERLALVFEQGEIMQRIEYELGLVVAARMHGDRLTATDNLDSVDVTLRQHLLMAIAGWNRVIVVAVAHQRHGRDARRNLVTGVIMGRRQRHERGYVRLHPFADRHRLAAQYCLSSLRAGVEEPYVERAETLRAANPGGSVP